MGSSTICRPGMSLLFVFFSMSRSVPSFTSCRSPREGAGKDLLDEQEYAERKRWESLSTKEKVGDWALKHQYSLILGSWATSMGVAAAIIMRDRNQTTSQKVREALSPSVLLDFDCVWVDCTSSYVGTGIDHWCPHRRWYPDTPSSQPSRCSRTSCCL